MINVRSRRQRPANCTSRAAVLSLVPKFAGLTGHRTQQWRARLTITGREAGAGVVAADARLTRDADLQLPLPTTKVAQLQPKAALQSPDQSAVGAKAANGSSTAGAHTLSNMEDEANLDSRRLAIGLKPICEYISGFAEYEPGEVYKPCRINK